jgi:hypothetical protein
VNPDFKCGQSRMICAVHHGEPPRVPATTCHFRPGLSRIWGCER